MNVRSSTPLLNALALWAIAAETLGQSTSPAATPNQPPVALVVTVTGIDAAGKLVRFTNPVGREFQVNYGALGTPVSVDAVTGPNVADITSINYDPQRRVIGFMLRTGYTVYYQYAEDGTQLIHDRDGEELTRSAQQTIIKAGTGARAVRLQSAVAALDSILKYSFH